MKTKKIGHAGRFGVRYGKTIRERFNAIQSKQKSRSQCPFCKKKQVKRDAKGIWSCLSCKKTFTGGAYFLNN